MSDTGRESLTSKVGATVKPDSEKSTTEHAGDYLKGKGDNLAGSAQPESEKSYTQQASDALSGNQSSGNSLIDQAKNAVGLGDQQGTNTTQTHK